jgi:hypothetical protein
MPRRYPSLATYLGYPRVCQIDSIWTDFGSSTGQVGFTGRRVKYESRFEVAAAGGLRAFSADMQRNALNYSLS